MFSFDQPGALRLGPLVAKLRSFKDQARPVRVAGLQWVHLTEEVDSYRGYYEQLYVGYTDAVSPPSCAEVANALAKAIDSRFTGYKGGEYWMDASTPVWVDRYGECCGALIIDAVEIISFGKTTDIVVVVGPNGYEP